MSSIFHQTDLLVLGNNVLEHRGVNDGIVSPLLHRDTVNLSGFDFWWNVVGVHLPVNMSLTTWAFEEGTNLKNAVLSALLLLQDLQCLGLVPWCNDTVGNFPRDDLGSRSVDLVRKGDKVSERRHPIGP